MNVKSQLFTRILLVTLFATTLALVVVASESGSIGQSSTSMLTKPLLIFISKIFRWIDWDKNAILSPISIHKALNMVLLGSDSTSQTERELIEVLGLKGLTGSQILKCHEEYASIIAKFKKTTKESDELYRSREKIDKAISYEGQPKPPIIDIFNMVITKDLGEVQTAYANKVKQYYDSSVVKIDDEKPETKSNLLSELNSWAKNAGFEQPIMKPAELDGKFSAILLSAIRIQAFWFDNFHESEREEAFHNYGRASEPVKGAVLSQSSPQDAKYLELISADKAKYKFLNEKLRNSSSATLFNELSALNMQVIEVPLQGDLSFTIFEPLNLSGSGGELKVLIERLMQTNNSSEEDNLGKVFSLLDSDLGANHVDSITFPKFNFENEINLQGPLRSSGLNRVFSKDEAEVSHVMEHKVYVEKIIHQAMIDVNKFGIKAAGVTKVKLMPLMAIFRPEPIRVTIENPFMFVIRHEKLPLFVGQLVEL